MFTLNNKVYVAGGGSDGVTTDTIEEYDPADETPAWNNLGFTLPIPVVVMCTVPVRYYETETNFSLQPLKNINHIYAIITLKFVFC